VGWGAAPRSNIIMSGIKTVRVVGLIFLLPSNTVSTAIEPLTSAVRALSRAARLFADAIVCRTATHQHVEMEVRFMLGISTRA
jgi:hypothetical protein